MMPGKKEHEFVDPPMKDEGMFRGIVRTLTGFKLSDIPISVAVIAWASLTILILGIEVYIVYYSGA